MPVDPIHTTFSRNPFATFAPQPVGVTFETQEPGEKIILLLRAHIVTLVPSALITIILLFVPILFGFFLNLVRLDLSTVLSARQQFLAAVFWYLLVFAYTLYWFLHWYFNVYLVTNERIVDFDFIGLLDKKIAFAKLMQIEDVTPKTIGFFATFFNYGDVLIQTAAAIPEFRFAKVPRPDVVAQEILEQSRLEEEEDRGAVQ